MQGIGIAVLVLCMLCVLPSCWGACNAMFPCVPYALRVRYTPTGRMLLRTYVLVFCVTLFATVEPLTSSATPPVIWWIRPVYAILPAAFALHTPTKRITLLVLVGQLLGLLLGVVCSLALLSLGFALREVHALQVAVLALTQPAIACVYGLVGVHATRRFDRRAVFDAQLLQSLLVYDGIQNGALVGDAYHAWVVPVIGSLSFLYGWFALFLVALFVSNRWECICCAAELRGDDPTIEDHAGATEAAVEVDLEAPPSGRAPLPSMERDVSRSSSDDDEPQHAPRTDHAAFDLFRSNARQAPNATNPSIARTNSAPPTPRGRIATMERHRRRR